MNFQVAYEKNAYFLLICLSQHIDESVNFYSLFESFLSILIDCTDQSSPVLLGFKTVTINIHENNNITKQTIAVRRNDFLVLTDSYETGAK